MTAGGSATDVAARIAPTSFLFYFLDFDSDTDSGVEAITVSGFDSCFLSGTATANLASATNDQAASYAVCDGANGAGEERWVLCSDRVL